MKIVILGAGALGSIIGGHLAQAGEEVTIIARGQRATGSGGSQSAVTSHQSPA